MCIERQMVASALGIISGKSKCCVCLSGIINEGNSLRIIMEATDFHCTRTNAISISCFVAQTDLVRLDGRIVSSCIQANAIHTGPIHVVRKKCRYG